jgi:nucleotide-binding universal stress UspA family protein
MSGDRDRVVVGLDGSSASLVALRWAVSEAGYRHADVDAIACWYPPLVAEASAYEIGFLEPDEYSARARETLDVALASVAADVDLAATEGRSVSARLLEGEPGHTLVAESKDATVVVVGRRGRGRLSRLLLGSVSRYVADHVDCPVVVVPGDDRP